MTDTNATEKNIVLPSDQEASGRTLGQEELDLLAEVIGAGKLFAPKGKIRQGVGGSFRGSAGDRARLRVHLRIGSHPHRHRGDRPRAGRRDHHHAHHRHGRPDPDSLPGRDPGVCRRGSDHPERDRGNHRGKAQRPDEGDHRHPPLRIALRHDRHHAARRREGYSGHRGLRPGVSRRAPGSQGGDLRRSRLLQPSAGQARHHRRGWAGGFHRPRHRAEDLPLHQQGLGLRRSRIRTTTSWR